MTIASPAMMRARCGMARIVARRIAAPETSGCDVCSDQTGNLQSLARRDVERRSTPADPRDGMVGGGGDRGTEPVVSPRGVVPGALDVGSADHEVSVRIDIAAVHIEYSRLLEDVLTLSE